MTAAPIPHYPVIHVDVRADGSAHVNVAGRHIDHPAGPVADTRAAVTRYAVDMALTLGRPVRMNTTDPAGTFQMAAHPDGTLTDLAGAEGKPQRRHRPQPEQKPAPSTLATAVVRPPAAAPPPATQTEPEAVRPAPHHAAVLSAVLTLSSGEAVTVTGSALVGRRPTSLDDENVDSLIAIDDSTRTVSRTHVRAEWHADHFWITDRGTGNGTVLQRQGAPDTILTAWQPHDAKDGDILLVGDVTVTVTIDDPAQLESRS